MATYHGQLHCHHDDSANLAAWLMWQRSRKQRSGVSEGGCCLVILAILVLLWSSTVWCPWPPCGLKQWPTAAAIYTHVKPEQLRALADKIEAPHLGGVADSSTLQHHQ